MPCRYIPYLVLYFITALCPPSCSSLQPEPPSSSSKLIHHATPGILQGEQGASNSPVDSIEPSWHAWHLMCVCMRKATIINRTPQSTPQLRSSLHVRCGSVSPPPVTFILLSPTGYSLRYSRHTYHYRSRMLRKMRLNGYGTDCTAPLA